MHHRLEPKIIQVFREGYSFAAFRADLLAGLTVGIIALPLALAFAIASGVQPQQGIYTAIIAGFVISLLGGSRVQISGPTGAFVVVVLGIVQQHGYQGLAVATFLAGIILVALGLAGMGSFLKFIPYPLTVGFTSGIAVVIFSLQVKDFFGLPIEQVPHDFFSKWFSYLQALPRLSWSATALALISLAIIIYWKRVSQRVPGSLIAIAGTTFLAWLFGLPVDTVGSRFGTFPQSLPSPTFPALDWQVIRDCVSPAFSIALLGAIESLLSAVVADGMLNTRHRSNMELIAQGVGNILSPIFQGIPATGAIARTATNVKSGGRSPISGMVHALTLLLILLSAGPLAALIPMPTLAAILVVVAYNMSEWRTFRHFLSAPRGDVLIMLLTFLLTVLIDLTVAIEIGVLLSAFVFLSRMEDALEVRWLGKQNGEADDDYLDKRLLELPSRIEVFRIQGPLFFAAVERFQNALYRVEARPLVWVLDFSDVPFIDATGMHVIGDFLDKIDREKGRVLLTGTSEKVTRALERQKILARLPQDQVFKTLDAGLLRARALVAQNP